MKTVDGFKRAFDDLYNLAGEQDDNDPRENVRDRVQILPDLYAAALSLAEAKNRLAEVMDEARSAGMSEDIRAMIVHTAEEEAEF